MTPYETFVTYSCDIARQFMNSSVTNYSSIYEALYPTQVRHCEWNQTWSPYTEVSQKSPLFPISKGGSFSLILVFGISVLIQSRHPEKVSSICGMAFQLRLETVSSMFVPEKTSSSNTITSLRGLKLNVWTMDPLTSHQTMIGCIAYKVITSSNKSKTILITGHYN